MTVAAIAYKELSPKEQEQITAILAAPKFLEDDIMSLLALGFIRLAEYNSSGNPMYAITRLGSAFASQLQSSGNKESAVLDG